MRKTLAVLLAFTITASPALAGSASSPEVGDKTGDVDVQHLVEAGALDEADVSQDQAKTVGDIDRAWVHTETKDSFQITVRLSDIPDQQDTSAPLMETWTHFTVNEANVVYHAQAVLLSPQPGAPLQADFQLYEGASRIASMPGNVDTENDTLRFTVSKAAIGEVSEGDSLTEPYVTTHLPGSQATLDYAPGAKRDSLPSPEKVDGVEPTNLDLAVDAKFGDSYTFQSFVKPQADLGVSITPSQLEIEAGNQEEFSVKIVNEADTEDVVQLSTGSAPDGWSVRLDTGELTIPPGESRGSLLYVSPSNDAEGHQLVHLEINSELGAQQGATVSVTASQPDDGTGDGSGASSDGSRDGQATSSDTGDASGATDSKEPASGDGASTDEGSGDGADGSNTTESRGAPGPGPVALLATLGLLATALGRRS